MLSIKKILFPTDFSRGANLALLEALFLAEQHQAELHFVHIVDPYDDPNNPTHRFPTVQELTALTKDLLSSERLPAFAPEKLASVKLVTTFERHLSVAPAILSYVERNDIDLIVMGTHGRRGLRHLLLGSVTEEVVRFAPCPVFTVRDQKGPVTVRPIRRILVPVDFSEHARLALAHAKELASLYGAELQILHVFEEVIHPAFYVSGKTSIFEFMPQVQTEATKQIQQLLDEVVGNKYPAEIYLKEGHPAQEIVNFVGDHGTDLIVIATHGLTGIEHFLLGSVTEKVVRMAACPVFTVKGFGKSLVPGTFIITESEDHA